ncbi:MAG: hypothetical protein ACYSU0_14425 [Planctomycetota bacterium]
MILVPGTCLLIAMSLLLVLCVSGMAGSGRQGSAHDEIYDAEGQRERAKAFITEFAGERVDLFDEGGRWRGPAAEKPWRSLELSAYVNPFLESGNATAIRRTNAIIEKNDAHQLDAAYALLRHRHLLSDEAVARMEALVREHAETRFQEFRWRFQGDNDNFPLMAAAVIAMWGTYTDDHRHVEDARSRLEEFKALLTRRGVASEFNSPAYLGLHLHPLALIAETTRDEELRRLAVDLETRSWIDLLGHYHPPCGIQAGPYSREYNFGVYGAGFTRLNLYLLLGEKLPGDWREGYRSETREHGLVRAANRACVGYHCPAWLAEWALARRYPYQMIATAEGGASFEWLEPDKRGALYHWMWKSTPDEDARLYELPAWSTRLVTYMTGDYSLGTTARMFNDGFGCYGFVATVPTKKPLASVRDAVRVHCRYVLNEDQPGVTWQDPKQKDYAKGQVAFNDGGRMVALQHEKTAMVLYRPRVIVGHSPTSLKAMVIIPNADFGEGACRGDETYLGDARVEDFHGESEEPAPAFVRLGETYMAFIPLINNSEVSLSRRAAVRVRPEGKGLGISFYNYEASEGDPIQLNPRQYTLVGNGFVCEMGSGGEDGSFEAFRRRFASVTVRDFYRRTIHSRGAYTRHVRYSRRGLTLEMEYNPATEGIRYQAINGKTPPAPQLEATGLPVERVPWL